MQSIRANIFGALAQLGEHLLCKQGVIGSIPIGSTKALLERVDVVSGFAHSECPRAANASETISKHCTQCLLVILTGSHVIFLWKVTKATR